jgi:hypothetical protein
LVVDCIDWVVAVVVVVVDRMGLDWMMMFVVG